MDQPAEETAAAAVALEDLCDDLHALKKLYGLLQRENTNEFQLDEASRNFLKKVLDGATLRILNQAKIVPPCEARRQDHSMSPAAASLITTPAAADRKKRMEQNRRPTQDLKRLNSRGSSASIRPRQQKKTKLQNTTTTTMTPTPVESDVVRKMDRSSKHSNGSLRLGKSTAKRSSRHGIVAGMPPSTQATANGRAKAEQKVEADAKVEQVRRREKPPCLYEKSERAASEVRHKQPVHDQEMTVVRPNHRLLHDHQSLVRPSIHLAGKHETKKQSGDLRGKALPSTSRQKARSESTVEHSLSSKTESSSSSNTSRQNRAMPSKHGGKPPPRSLNRRRQPEPPINRSNQRMEKEGRLERLKNKLSVIFHHHHHHHHLHHSARNGDGVVRRRHRSLWEYLRSVGHRNTNREMEGLGRRPPVKQPGHRHALLEALFHLFMFSTKKEARKRAPPLGTAKKKFRWWQRLGRRVRLTITRRHRKNARLRLGIGMTK
ncbi:protein KOKOPELLI-like isoform X1 [Zingiber officinale]|uniref:protein KOKOPELLI-like isoform X1 n=1 Tax=Zingiber officinale TaxID=94328 RepID=UPI001C4C307C|nr:protein KOKOPELLI-like isoform X1 [Zingiber officinale]